MGIGNSYWRYPAYPVSEPPSQVPSGNVDHAGPGSSLATFPANPADYRRITTVGITPSEAQAPAAHFMLARWPGSAVHYPVLFSPHLKSNNALKSYGFPNSNEQAKFYRPDVHPIRVAALRRAINASSKVNASSDNRAIPGVYVPTTLRNGYNQGSTW